MLTLTQNAVTVIRTLATRTDDPRTGGLRIRSEAERESHFAVDLATEPEIGDEVVEDHGARVFLDPVACPRMETKELDALIDGGSVRFEVRDQERPALL
ncbi:Fe-S cluster assembly iron-binding protein IscA [Plantibacter flavus]|uniref:Fe-S cluster assembly iron-binding protein IscA n=1 Tax=Plantibacter flavus TaxID=150123 RepID=A0A3N2BXT7_9MICO|nr:hypothetical protein [Plantibacter flavus]ROR80057.1 Fe-S cluster assembly iron-binding protein IscA [Plantibacter flavus]SMG29072.1 Fe-S cluster assembly iron-binding protein IscA [Plantibacter flavus]